MIHKLTFLIFLFVIASYSFAGAEEFVIRSVNPSPIKIGGEKLTNGKTFSDSQKIEWLSNSQAMNVIPIKGGSPRSYSAKRFNYKNMSVIEYNRVVAGSQMGSSNQWNLSIGKNKESFTETRIALVIGNANYSYINSLNTPTFDAIDVSDKLLDLGFDVISAFDLSSADFSSVLKLFSGMAQGYDVVLIYYSGHGIQNNGRNYLIPIDQTTNIRNIYLCVDIKRDVCPVLDSTGSKTKLLFLNACRNEPDGENNDDTFKDDDIKGIKISFSTAPGEAAYECDMCRNSPYTEAFLQNVGLPSPNIASTITNIAVSLESISNRMGLPYQEPHDFGSSKVSFTFVSPNSSVVDLLVTDINELERLADEGDSRAYIKIAQYYLYNNWSGYTSSEKAYIYALKAWNAEVNVEEAKVIFNHLEKLGFYDISNYKKPY